MHDRIFRTRNAYVITATVCIGLVVTFLGVYLTRGRHVASQADSIMVGHTDRVTSITFSADGKLLASASDDRTARLWEVPTGQMLRSFQAGQEGLTVVALSPKSDYIAAAGMDHRVYVWDAASSQLQRLLTESHGADSLIFAPDGQSLLAGGVLGAASKTVTVWNTNSWQVVHQQVGPQQWSSISMSVHPENALLAVSGGDSPIKFWDLATWKECATLNKCGWAVGPILFTPDGKKLVAHVGEDQTIRIYDVENSTEDRRFHVRLGQDIRMALSPDGKLLAVTSGWAFQARPDAPGFEIVRLFDFSTGTVLATVELDTKQSKSVAFSPNGDLLAIAHGNTIKLWKVANALKEPRQKR